MSVPFGEPRETLGKLRVNPSILDFSVALERPLGRRFRSGGHPQGSPAEEGRGYGQHD